MRPWRRDEPVRRSASTDVPLVTSDGRPSAERPSRSVPRPCWRSVPVDVRETPRARPRPRATEAISAAIPARAAGITGNLSSSDCTAAPRSIKPDILAPTCSALRAADARVTPTAPAHGIASARSRRTKRLRASGPRIREKLLRLRIRLLARGRMPTPRCQRGDGDLADLGRRRERRRRRGRGPSRDRESRSRAS